MLARKVMACYVHYMTVTRNEKGRWLPGSVPNPNGRPKVNKEFRVRIRGIVDSEVLDRIVAEIRNDGPEWYKCAKLLVNYAYGMPPQTFDGSVKLESALDRVPTSVLEKVEAMLVQANAAERTAEEAEDEVRDAEVVLDPLPAKDVTPGA